MKCKNIIEDEDHSEINHGLLSSLMYVCLINFANLRVMRHKGMLECNSTKKFGTSDF